MTFFTTDLAATPIHVCRMGFTGELWPFFRPNFTNIAEYMRKLKPLCSSLKSAVAIIPSGWADASPYNRRNALQARDVC